MVYDYVIIGSGFGGSVAALRLAEKGYTVAILEMGKHLTSDDFDNGCKSVRNLIWQPAIGMKGYFLQEVFAHLAVIGGVGVGGGSNVYAAVLLEPKDDFYSDTSWSDLGVNWKDELAVHYETASLMLGVEKNPFFGTQDEYLKKTAESMGAGETFGPVPSGIYFGKSEIKKSDPYFDGQGPSRTGCHLCGKCMTGCPHGSKNSLDKNYLYLAQKKGVRILPGRKAENIIPLSGGGYTVRVCDPHSKRKKYPSVSGKNLIVAGGVLGTLDLLYRCREITKTLPEISAQLGTLVRTNSEAIVGVMDSDPGADMANGPSISSEFYPDKYTHITQNRFSHGYDFMKWYFGPLIDDSNPVRRSLRTLFNYMAHPFQSCASLFGGNFYRRITALTVMQNHDNRLAFDYGRSLYSFFGYRLKSRKLKAFSAPSNLPVANKTAKTMAEISNGTPLNFLSESIGNISTTAHILGGCHMGNSKDNGVIDTNHEVFGYPGLYIMDGSSISANVGVNPSLTICALAERAVKRIPDNN